MAGTIATQNWIFSADRQAFTVLHNPEHDWPVGIYTSRVDRDDAFHAERDHHKYISIVRILINRREHPQQGAKHIESIREPVRACTKTEITELAHARVQPPVLHTRG